MKQFFQILRCILTAIVSSIVRLMTYRSSVDADHSFTHVVARKNVSKSMLLIFSIVYLSNHC